MDRLKQLRVFLETSTVRRRVLTAFAIGEKDYMSPSEIVRQTKLDATQVSLAIRQLEGKGLVLCLTPGKRAWKAYEITNLGKEVLKTMDSLR